MKKEVKLSDEEINDLIMCVFIASESPWQKNVSVAERLFDLDVKLTKLFKKGKKKAKK